MFFFLVEFTFCESFSFFIFLKIMYLFLAVLGFHCCSRAFSHSGAWASHCSGFSCCRTQALGMWASLVVAQGLSCPRRVESSWTRDQICVLCIEDNASGFLTTEPPGKSESLSFPH